MTCDLRLLDWHVQRPDHAKTVAAAEVVVVAIARARFIRGRVPDAAAYHAFGEVAFQPRRGVGRRVFAVALVETVLGPFPDVAMHLIQSERVRGVGIHHDRALAVHAARAVGIRRSGGIIGILRRDGLAEPEQRRGAGAGEIFALGFAWQTIGAADLARQTGELGCSHFEADAL